MSLAEAAIKSLTINLRRCGWLDCFPKNKLLILLPYAVLFLVLFVVVLVVID